MKYFPQIRFIRADRARGCMILAENQQISI
jgi:hypothetical protein